VTPDPKTLNWSVNERLFWEDFVAHMRVRKPLLVRVALPLALAIVGASVAASLAPLDNAIASADHAKIAIVAIILAGLRPTRESAMGTWMARFAQCLLWAILFIWFEEKWHMAGSLRWRVPVIVISALLGAGVGGVASLRMPRPSLEAPVSVAEPGPATT
jgi:hypothetical protein